MFLVKFFSFLAILLNLFQPGLDCIRRSERSNVAMGLLTEVPSLALWSLMKTMGVVSPISLASGDKRLLGCTRSLGLTADRNTILLVAKSNSLCVSASPTSSPNPTQTAALSSLDNGNLGCVMHSILVD